MKEGGDASFACSTGNVEHYTPRYIWERAFRAMGTIDLDPSSDPDRHIPASIHYTKEENGLLHPWKGRIWLNPPYGDGVIKWFRHLQKYVEMGHVTAAIILWKSATETEAWRLLCSISSSLCLPYKRINFEGPDSKGGGCVFSPALFYIGAHPESFRAAFSDIGMIWQVPEASQNYTLWDCIAENSKNRNR